MKDSRESWAPVVERNSPSRASYKQIALHQLFNWVCVARQCQLKLSLSFRPQKLLIWEDTRLAVAVENS
jgi:hypothetical protein